MSYGVIIPVSIAAMNIDAYNRSAIYTGGDIDNGNVVVLATKSTTIGDAEVWTATVPATGALTSLWMAYEPEIVTTVSGSSYYKGLDPDPRNFTNLASTVFSTFAPQVGDVIIATADCFAGTQSTNTFVNATTATGGIHLYWGATKTASVLSMHITATTYISIGSGAIDTQRVTAYQFEVVGI